MFRIKDWIAVAGILITAVCLWGLWFNRYDVVDWYVLRGYNPDSQISSLATNSGMSAKGAKVFYAQHPRITDKEEFNAICTTGEQTIVLGCYTGYDLIRDSDIFIYNVSEPELQGIQEVTAAHEMLHAAYDRLSSSERKTVDSLTAAMLQNINSPRITKLIEGYQERDPSSVPNELHSILATEVAVLDPALEAYYAQYFSNRQKVVSLSEKYESVFESNTNETQRIAGELSLRKSELAKLEASIDADYIALDASRASLDRLRSANNINAYNSAVPAFNQQVANYNQAVANYKRLIAEYNSLVEAYNQKVGRQQELVQSIDSKYQPVN